ncbi:SGNH/GDSL hydrolase family protein [Algoriphagus machipongonensis]|nr:SGNH/GDSL hydrolase family protein [Algoriphagus machipongonensis]
MIKPTFILLLFTALLACEKPKSEPMTTMTDPKVNNQDPLNYLALGDSYTIGEGVSDTERYPVQLVSLLNQQSDSKWDSPKIIAQTGWTVKELDEGINNTSLEDQPYDLVTLLIGVNDQYRGGSVEELKVNFEQMLLRAIGFAGNLPNHVIVISIPDWGVTPFAVSNGRDPEQIASEINAFNSAQKVICEKYGVDYVDITEDYRINGNEAEMLVSDNLHPSGLIYKSWAEKLADLIKSKAY